MTEQELAELASLAKKATPGKWLYRPYAHDDWGMVRGWSEDDERMWVVANVRGGRYIGADEQSAHRDAGTDPYGDNARFIAAANPEKILALISLLQAQQEEIGRLREAVKPFAALGQYMIDEGFITKPDEATAWGFDRNDLTYGNFRSAARALSTQGTQT